MSLSEQTCVPCEGGVQPLNAEEIQKLVQDVPEWEVVRDHHISRSFKFKNFRQALEFVNRVGELAENEGHHPEIQFGWGHARVELWTHAIDGLHRNDFILAAKIDELAQ